MPETTIVVGGLPLPPQPWTEMDHLRYALQFIADDACELLREAGAKCPSLTPYPEAYCYPCQARDALARHVERVATAGGA